jgi:hypothetical protein
VNIFALASDPKEAAGSLCDAHVVKMLLESAQILSTVCHLKGEPGPYKPTHVNHPCTVWARESRNNYLWLLEHTKGLAAEYHDRFGKTKGKTHKTATLLPWFETNLPDLPDTDLTPFAQAMPDTYRHEDGVTAYRAYYLGEKAPKARYYHSTPPDWVRPSLRPEQIR